MSSDSDNAGNLWFGTKKELLYFQATKRRFTSFKNPFNAYPVQQVVCAGESIYLLYGNQQVYVFNTLTKRFLGLPKAFSAKQLFRGTRGVYAVSGEHRIYSLNKEKAPTIFLNAKRERCIVVFLSREKYCFFFQMKRG